MNTQRLFPVDTELELAELMTVNGLKSRSGPWITYHDGQSTACLDGDFTATELAAIAFYMLDHANEALKHEIGRAHV